LGVDHQGALAMDLAVTAVGTTAVAVAAGLNGGFLPGVLAGRMIDWALAAWVWVGIPLAIIALPVSVAWAVLVRLAVLSLRAAKARRVSRRGPPASGDIHQR
jgi:hypothetical protein